MELGVARQPSSKPEIHHTAKGELRYRQAKGHIIVTVIYIQGLLIFDIASSMRRSKFLEQIAFNNLNIARHAECGKHISLYWFAIFEG